MLNFPAKEGNVYRHIDTGKVGLDSLKLSDIDMGVEGVGLHSLKLSSISSQLVLMLHELLYTMSSVCRTT